MKAIRRDAFLFLLLAAGLPARAQAPNGDPEALAREREIASAIRETEMSQAVRRLVSFGPRMGGSASGDRAAAWIEERFSGFGLEVEAREDPALDVHETLSLSVRLREGEAPWRPIESAVAYGFSPSGRVRARLSLEPAADEDVVLLVDRVPRGGVAPRVAALLVDGDAVPETDFVRLRFLRPSQRDRAVPTVAIPGSQGEALRLALEEKQRPQVEIDLETRASRRSPRSVVARLPGKDAARWILFCAHGDADSGGPGANDNASGVAVVLEIARVLSASRERGFVPPVEVRFAVWGSEIHSTRSFLERERDAGRLAGLLGVFNFDQSGYGTGDEALFVEPDDLPSNERIVRALLAVAMDHAGEAGFPDRFTSNRSLGGTDSYVFSDDKDADGGTLPAVTVFTSAFGRSSRVPATADFPRRGFDGKEIVVDYDRAYHTSGDLPENTTDLEPHNMGWCARVAALGALRLATEAPR